MASYDSAMPGLRRSAYEAERRGRVGRMFDLLPFGRVGEPTLEGTLEKLSQVMIEEDVDVPASRTPADGPTSNNRSLPAGYSFLGQFIDHDLSFEARSALRKTNDVEALGSYRSAAFDLDSVYAGGPENAPFLYEAAKFGRFLIGGNPAVPDLLRNDEGTALVGDRRSDGNIVTAQLHLLFLQFHNRIYDELFAHHNRDRRVCFELARTLVRYHYQWLVLTDFLPRIVPKHILATMQPGSSFFNAISAPQWGPALRFFWRWGETPYVPVEFSAAAFRYGHSTLRNAYVLSERSGLLPLSSQDKPDLRGRRRVTTETQVDWQYFFGDFGQGTKVQPARSIDTMVAAGLSKLTPDVSREVPSLPLLTLLRGVALGLPSGQMIARAIGLQPDHILRDDALFATPAYQEAGEDGTTRPDASVPSAALDRLKGELTAAFGRGTPLWYYILKEAEVFEGGQRLGAVGGTLVAETILGLMISNLSSFQNESPLWRPKEGSCGCLQSGVYKMLDLIRHAQLG